MSPRVGIAWTPIDRVVIRSGYGLFSAPWQYSATEHGQIGFARTTNLNQSSDATEVPLTTLDNPFPSGLQPPLGSSLGLLTGLGSNITVIDQDRGASKVHQHSIDVQRELGASVAVTVGYTGATGRDLGFGGTNNTTININQIDPAVARAAFPGPNGTWDAAALRASIPNPFFGIAEAGEFATRPTIQRGQLLRPFPQFGDVLMSETTKGGKRQFRRHVQAGQANGPELVGRRWLHVEQHQGQPVRRDQLLQPESEPRAEQLRPGCGVWAEQLRLAAPDHPGAHRPVPGPAGRWGQRLLGDWTISAIAELVERRAAQRDDQWRRV